MAETVQERINNYLTQEESDINESQDDQVKSEQQQDQHLESEEKEEKTEPEEEEESEGKEDVIEIEDLTSLAEHIGVKVSDLYALKIPVTSPDGTRSQVTLGEYKDGYVSHEQNKKKQSELDNLKNTIESKRLEQEQIYVRRLQETQAVIDTAEKQFLHDLQRVNWDQLRKENPGEFAAKQTELANRKAILNQAIHQVNQHAETSRREWMKKQQEDLSQILSREGQALLDSIPEWKKDDTRESERHKISDYLIKQGYTAEQINGKLDNEGGVVSHGIIDHRYIVMARKAMLYDKQITEAKLTAKKVLKIGKNVLKPGASQNKEQAAQDRFSEAREKLRKSGGKSKEAAIAAIRELI